MEQLIAIYNLLLQIDVRGNNVLVLSDALRGLRAYIETNQSQDETNQSQDDSNMNISE